MYQCFSSVTLKYLNISSTACNIKCLLCRCCCYCVNFLYQICNWPSSRSRCIHSSSLLFVVYMTAKCRCSVGRTADVLHLCSCSHTVDMHWMYGPHLNTHTQGFTLNSSICVVVVIEHWALLHTLHTEDPCLLSPPHRTEGSQFVRPWLPAAVAPGRSDTVMSGGKGILGGSSASASGPSAMLPKKCHSVNLETRREMAFPEEQEPPLSRS